jgi:6,7-dimethyl-8-ribityllumazine synthase
MSRFNQEIGEGLLSACTSELSASASTNTHYAGHRSGRSGNPPGPADDGAKRRFDALVALGAVIRGETYHFEIVANDSCRALDGSAARPACRSPTAF